MRSPDLLRLFGYFVAVVEEGHFGHAARRLGMTQPPLSQGLQRLEAELGVRLLDRGPKGVSVTTGGAAMLPHARRLLKAERDAREAARTHALPETSMRLGVVPQLPALFSARLASAVRDAMPSAGVTVHEATTSALVSGVTAGRYHLGVVVHPAVLGPLEGSDVVRLPTFLLVPEPSPTATPSATRLRDLVRLPLAVQSRAQGPAAHDLLTDTLHAHGVGVGTVVVDDERSALALVATGQACALTADRQLHAEGVARVRLSTDLLPLRVRVVWDPERVGGLPDGLGHELTAALRASVATSEPEA